MHNYALLLLLFYLPSTRPIDNADDKNYDDFPQSPTIIPPSQTIQLGVTTTRIKDEDSILEERFGRIIDEAVTISRSLKYGLNREEGASTSLPSSFHLLAKLIKRESDGKRTILHFIVEMDGRIVQSEAIVRDISLLSMQELSAILQYPVSSISTTSMQVVEESATWWKIGLIIGGGVILLLLGWCCLFVYFNTCGRVSFTDQRKKEELYEERMEERREEEKEERQLGETKEERRDDRREEMMEVEEERQREIVVVEEERRERTKQEPVIVDFEDEEKKEEKKEEAEEGRRDSIESLEISDEAGEELQDDSSPLPVTSSRPRAAGLRRPMRTMDGRVIAENPAQEWTTFSAGDRVNAIFSIRPPSSYEHPTPSPSTLNGVVQYSTTQGNTAFSHFL